MLHAHGQSSSEQNLNAGLQHVPHSHVNQKSALNYDRRPCSSCPKEMFHLVDKSGRPQEPATVPHASRLTIARLMYSYGWPTFRNLSPVGIHLLLSRGMFIAVAGPFETYMHGGTCSQWPANQGAQMSSAQI